MPSSPCTTLHLDMTTFGSNQLQASVVSIGNFDGCHRGHQKLLATAVAHGQTVQAPAAALTFSPRPDVFFRGAADSARELFSDAQKFRALGELGISYHVVQQFNAAFSKITHQEFYTGFLRQMLGAKAIVIGEDFRFGNKRLGDAAWLQAAAGEDGIPVTVVPPLREGETVISSTKIRQELEHGRVDIAAQYLGRPYLLEGNIDRGDRIGTKIGCPTANLTAVTQLLPRAGIYAGWIWIGEPGSATGPAVTQRDPQALPAVFSIGPRPTVDPTLAPRIEGHLIDFPARDLYGCRAGFYLSHWLREIEMFPTLEEMTTQIHSDIAFAKNLLQR